MNAITETVYRGENGIQTEAEWYTGQISLVGADIPPLDLDVDMTTYIGAPHNCAIAFLTENPDSTLKTGTTMREVLRSLVSSWPKVSSHTFCVAASYPFSVTANSPRRSEGIII